MNSTTHIARYAEPAYDAARGVFEFEKGAWFPWWAVLMIPFLTTLWLLCRIAGRRVNWKAAWGTVAVFETLVSMAEAFSVSRGHWVYNKARILGPTVFQVPIEEQLLYYLFGPLVVITALHAVRMGAEALRDAPRRWGRRRGDRRGPRQLLSAPKRARTVPSTSPTA